MLNSELKALIHDGSYCCTSLFEFSFLISHPSESVAFQNTIQTPPFPPILLSHTPLSLVAVWPCHPTLSLVNSYPQNPSQPLPSTSPPDLDHVSMNGQDNVALDITLPPGAYL